MVTLRQSPDAVKMVRKQYKSVNFDGMSLHRNLKCLSEQFIVTWIAKKRTTIVSDDGKEIRSASGFRSTISHLHQWREALGFTRGSGS